MQPAIDPPDSGTVGTSDVGSVPDESTPEENTAVVTEVFPERFLRVQNATAEPMKVYVQFHAQVDENKWAWVPADPKDSARAVMLQVGPGKEALLADDEGPISANRVRIWAMGPSKRITEYRNQDLWLVPEVNQAGEHVYRRPGNRDLQLRVEIERLQARRGPRKALVILPVRKPRSGE
jgi:hypothetical protein